MGLICCALLAVLGGFNAVGGFRHVLFVVMGWLAQGFCVLVALHRFVQWVVQFAQNLRFKKSLISSNFNLDERPKQAFYSLSVFYLFLSCFLF